MTLLNDLTSYINENNGIITTEDSEKNGYSRAILSKYVKQGYLIRVKQGQYSLNDNVIDDMYVLGNRSKYIIFSHESALFLNKLSDRTPFIHSITIPSNVTVAKSINDTSNVFYIKPALYNIGASKRVTTFGNDVMCYDAERTICDLFRSRNRLNEELVILAIKNYAKSSKKNLRLLSEYAEVFRVTNAIKPYLEVLL